MTAQEAFAAMVAGHIAPVLQGEGFTQTGDTVFHRTAGRNWEVVQFEPSKVAIADRLKFTVRLAVAIDRLRGEDPQWRDGLRPAEHECHFAKRLGQLLAGRDVFWDVRPDTDVAALGDTLNVALRRYGLPWLEERSDDERLRDLCLANLSAVPWWELRPLRELIEQLGPDEARSALEDELRRRASAEEAGPATEDPGSGGARGPTA